MAKKEYPAKTRNIVYVVFHGLTPIVEKKCGEFCVYILSMGDEHRYLYGDWLREVNIPAGFAAEFVVGAGPATRTGALDASKRPTILLKKPVDEQHEAIHGRIRFPRPNQIIYGNSGSLKLKSGQHLLVNPKVGVNAGATTFAYEVADFEGCYLVREHGSIKWEPTFRTKIKENQIDYEIAALHLFSNPARETAPDHSEKEFSLSSELLGERAVKITGNGTDGTPAKRPVGLCPEEMLSLSRRDYILERLANRARGQVTLGIDNGAGCESCCSGADGSEG